MAERQRRLFHPRKLNHAARSVTTRSWMNGSQGMTFSRCGTLARALTDFGRLLLCLQPLANHRPTDQARALRPPSDKPWPSSPATCAGCSPTPFLRCQVPHPKKPKYTTSNQHNPPPFSTARAEKIIGQMWENPNDSHRRTAKRLSFFLHRAKIRARDEKFALTFGEIRNRRGRIGPVWRNGRHWSRWAGNQSFAETLNGATAVLAATICRICDGTNEIVTAQFEIKYTGKRAGAEAARLFRSQEKSATDAVRERVERSFCCLAKKDHFDSPRAQRACEL